jgi:hypothetical protein
MSEWEYIRLDLNGVRRGVQEIDLLNDAGKDGWELVTIQNGIAYLKRPGSAMPASRSTRRNATSDAK